MVFCSMVFSNNGLFAPGRPSNCANGSVFDPAGAPRTSSRQALAEEIKGQKEVGWENNTTLVCITLENNTQKLYVYIYIYSYIYI